VAAHIAEFDSGRPVDTIVGPPAIDGRFFYNENLDGVNFLRQPQPVSSMMQRMLEERRAANPHSLYIQSAPIADYLPGFEAANTLRLAPQDARPRIWMGNRLTVQTHFDLNENIACVVAGRRRFTLFPPSQTPNLYPGPFELTLAGPPVSMVQLETPDFDRFPRFREALAHAVVAELDPGDAIYIPYFWWHHVRALEDFNVLVNYWFNDAPRDLGSPYDALLHALLSIRDLPRPQREAWRTMLDYYVFRDYGDPVEHLPPHARGPLGAHDPSMRQRIRRILLGAIGAAAGIRPPPRP
jgi:hypothetical protein